MKTLKLTLKKKWFDMIASGVKKEEYRKEGQWIVSRLYERVAFAKRPYDAVEFTNGYGADRPFVRVEFLGFEYGGGKPEWGGAPDVYIIKLGKVLERRNCE